MYCLKCRSHTETNGERTTGNRSHGSCNQCGCGKSQFIKGWKTGIKGTGKNLTKKERDSLPSSDFCGPPGTRSFPAENEKHWLAANMVLPKSHYSDKKSIKACLDRKKEQHGWGMEKEGGFLGFIGDLFKKLIGLGIADKNGNIVGEGISHKDGGSFFGFIGNFFKKMIGLGLMDHDGNATSKQGEMLKGLGITALGAGLMKHKYMKGKKGAGIRGNYNDYYSCNNYPYMEGMGMSKVGKILAGTLPFAIPLALGAAVNVASKIMNPSGPDTHMSVSQWQGHGKKKSLGKGLSSKGKKILAGTLSAGIPIALAGVAGIAAKILSGNSYDPSSVWTPV